MQRRILLADDHPVVRCGVRSLLEARTELEFVVTEAETGKEAVEQIMQEQPDIAILDYWLPMINGLEVARQVKAGGSKVEIIIFTMLDSDSLADECFRCGARAYLLKSEPEQLVRAAIRAAGAHKPLIGGAVVERQLENRPNRDARYRKPSLTPRELTVLRLLAEGHSNKDIGRLLDLSVKTVETHRASAMHKAAVKSIAHLVRYAVKNQWVEP